MEFMIDEEVKVFLGGKMIYGYKVSKISKTGQITVQSGKYKYRFDSVGNEIGTTSAFYGKARLIKTK